MKKGLAFGLGALTGLAIGAASAWTYAKKKYEKESEEKINEARSEYLAMVKKIHEKNLAETEKKCLNQIIDEYCNNDVATTEAVFNAHNDGDGLVEPMTLPTIAGGVYRIEANEFSGNSEFTAETLFYFKNEDILTDDKYEIITNPVDIIGDLDLQEYVDDYDCIYIRNENRSVDYEVLLEERDLSEFKQ